jgi:gliding motility-associated protein GldM
MSGGGKETPRQKMIGMMYLFYTALLALQVDTAVLEKFILINKTLEHQIVDIDASNQKLFTGIETSVTEKGTRPDDKKVLDKAAKVRSETKAIISEFNKTKEEIIQLTGGLNENGQIVGAKDQDVVATMMITQGRGKEIQVKLNKYAAMLREVTEKGENEFPNIARDAKEYDEFKDDPAQKLKPFADLFFESTPTGAGLSSISQLESEVLQYETKALKFLGDQVGIKDVNFDQVFPLIRPESNIVAVGGKYSAEMFIAGSSSAFTPQMAVDDKDIPVDTMDINGMYVKYGKVEFNVSGGGEAVPGTRFRKKSFKAAITLNDSTYTQDVEYFTVNPVMQISSRALSALWRNCANELSVQVPELGNAYNPTINVTNADKVMGQGRGNVTIIPTSNRRVVLTVINSGLTIGSQDFRVKEIPLPTYSFKMGNSELDFEKGISSSAIRGTLNIEALAEENFKSDVPNDARYRIEDVDVFLKSGSDARVTTSEKGGDVRLREIQSAGPRKGEFLVIKVNRVSRINYKGERERISTRGAIYTIPIN